MKLISHRGNLSGKDINNENSPAQIDLVISLGFEVEVDLWIINGHWALGHDAPQYPIDLKWLSDRRNRLWIHCKNVEAIVELFKSKDFLNYFWHENDTVALTSQGYIWAYPGKQPIRDSIAVLPETNNDDISQCLGVCSDFIDSKHYEQMRTNFTILVQGNIEQETFDFYLKHYHDCDIIFSTWLSCLFNHSAAPINFKFIKARVPMIHGIQNFNLHVESTSNGLREVKTKYVIKVRGDEWYNNLHSALGTAMRDQIESIVPQYFLGQLIFGHTPGDHVMIGTTENLRTMFYNCKDFLIKYKTDTIAGRPKVAETMLTTAYLMAKLGITDLKHFTPERAREYMLRYFNVISLEGLKDYKVRYNTIKKTWYNSFNPKNETCIDNINEV